MNPRPRRPLALLVLAAAWCGCSNDAVVDLTIDVDPSVPAKVVAEVRSLDFDVSGLFTRMTSDPLSRPFAVGGSERIVIRSAIGGEVTLDVTARDGAGTALLTGETPLTLRSGATTTQSLTVRLAGSGDDGGVGSELGVVADLALPANGDLGTSPDLGTVVCPAGVLLCDGFESGIVGSGIWDDGATQSNATVTVDQTHVHRGQYALHVHTNVVGGGASAEATIGETHTFSPAGASFWVRAFYYLPSNGSVVGATLLDASQKMSPYNDVALAVDHDALAIYNAFNSDSYVASTTPKLPLDAWACIEWQVDTGTPNQMHVWINGQPVPALDVMQPTTAGQQIGIFSVGLGIYPPNTSPIALDAWIDDVIFDHAPIGCAK